MYCTIAQLLSETNRKNSITNIVGIKCDDL